MLISPKMRCRYNRNQLRIVLLKHEVSKRVCATGDQFSETLRGHKLDAPGTKKQYWMVRRLSWPAHQWFRNHKRKVSLARKRVEERRGLWPF
ncbi:MAG: hypothetical protein H2049_00535 [Porphyrobacter sp.]|nr:hypothetical protein [Porphyrobacter sp.]